MQRILVCAQDPVLAKKVRFLMERDECKVEILGSPAELEPRLEAAQPSLLVLSRQLDGSDAIDQIASLDPSYELPLTLVLGGEPRVAAEFIHIVPDPVDTQAIYREASRLLQQAEAEGDKAEDLPAAQIQLEQLDAEDIELSGDEDVLGGIARELDALEAEPIEDQIAAAFDIEDLPEDLGDEASLDFEDEPLPLEAEDMEVEEPTGELLTAPGAQPVEAFAEPEEIEPSAVSEPEAPEPEPIEAALPVEPPEEAPAASPEPSEPQAMAKTPAPSDSTPLEPAGFARALHSVWSRREKGALVVDRSDERLTLLFEDGRPVHVESSRPGDPLGKALVQRGRLSEAQYADAAKHAIERGTSLAESIVSVGFLTETDLGSELGTSARERLVGCFAESDGSFWFEAGRGLDSDARPYRLDVGQIIAQGLRGHAHDAVVDGILGEGLSAYFKLRRPGYELQKDFPLSNADLAFLEYEGRAYNLEDAADGAGLPLSEAKKLLALLAVCEEVEPFTPGAAEFEARIREERETRRELESRMPGQAPSSGAAPAWGAPRPAPQSDAAPALPRRPLPPPDAPDEEITRAEPAPAFPPPPGAPAAPAPESANGAAPSRPVPPALTDADVPPMPVPGAGEGSMPRPLAYAKPLPRGPDGGLLDTPERAISREHFQNGVSLLGKGSFSSAEEKFRDAVALCSEEHVYLIGLARAIYYNPSYRPEGKLPVLRSIVDRASNLAPDDKRVSTLEAWVSHAEAQFG